MENNRDQLSAMFRESFHDFQVQPTEGLWLRISKAYWMKYFLSFHIASFNVYYVVALFIASVTGATMLNNHINQYPDKQAMAIVEHKPDTVISTVDDTLYEESVFVKKDTVIDRFSIYWNGKLFDGTLEEKSYDEEIPAEISDLPPISDDKITNEELQKTKKAKDKLLKEKNNIQNQLPSNTFKRKNKKSENNRNKPNIIPEKTDNNNINKAVRSEKTITKTVYVYDTIQVVDTVRIMDTVHPEVFFPKITKQDLKWSIDAFASMAYTDQSLVLANQDRNDFFLKKQNSLSPSTSVNYGFNVNLNAKNFIFQTGISYARMGENFSDEFTSWAIDSTLNYEYTEAGGYWLLQPTDTVFFEWIGHSIVVYEEEWIQLYDSTEIMHYDSTEIINGFNEKNYYKYIEIPAIVGYELYKGRSTYGLKTGIITGFLMNSSGMTISHLDNTSILENNNENIPFVKMNYSFMLSLSYGYRLNNHFSLLAESYYRKNMNSLFQPKYPVIQKFNTAGLKLGIRYHF